VGYTITDIYPRESWDYVFGLADSSKRVGVFSFARYHDSFDTASFPDPKIDDPNEISYRACKVICHELGHLLGMRHCIHYVCLMNGSNTNQEAKRKPFQLCPICV
jgi:archaemetzincin